MKSVLTTIELQLGIMSLRLNNISKSDSDFKESDHPRAPDGKFGSGSKTSSPSKLSEAKNILSKLEEKHKDEMSFPGLLPDKVRNTDEYRNAKNIIDQDFKNQQKENSSKSKDTLKSEANNRRDQKVKNRLVQVIENGEDLTSENIDGLSLSISDKKIQKEMKSLSAEMKKGKVKDLKERLTSICEKI